MFDKKLMHSSIIYSNDTSYIYQPLIRNFGSLFLLMSLVGYIC